MENFLLALQVCILLAAGFYLLEKQRQYNQNKHEKISKIAHRRTISRSVHDYLDSLPKELDRVQSGELPVPHNFTIRAIRKND